MSKQSCQKKWYEKNKKTHIKNVAERRKIILLETKIKIFNYLKTHPCIDCGETDVVVLEFDHRENITKFKAVSDLVHKMFSWTVILKEIEKCDVRCSNCHARKTAKERGYYKYINASLAEK